MDGPATTQNRKARRKNKRKGNFARTPAEQFDLDLLAGRVQAHHLESRRYRATRRCCSATWAEHHWHGELHEGLARAWHTPVEYPPGGVGTKMVRCLACKRDTPPQCIVRHRGGQICQDCGIAGLKEIPPELSSHTVHVEARIKYCHKRGQSYDGLY